MNEYKGGSIKENLTELKLYFSAEWVQFLQHINNVNQWERAQVQKQSEARGERKFKRFKKGPAPFRLNWVNVSKLQGIELLNFQETRSLKIPI